MGPESPVRFEDAERRTLVGQGKFLAIMLLLATAITVAAARRPPGGPSDLIRGQFVAMDHTGAVLGWAQLRCGKSFAVLDPPRAETEDLLRVTAALDAEATSRGQRTVCAEAWRQSHGILDLEITLPQRLPAVQAANRQED